MSPYPLVSCVLTAYNYEQYVAGAVESALAQDWPADRLEVIVVDDGSTDGTASVLATFGDRVKVLRQENAGVIAATNRGIRESRGDLVALLDADDEWLPQKVRRQAEAFAAQPELGLLFGDMELMDGEGRTTHPSYFARYGMSPPSGHVLGPFLVRNWAPTATIMLRRELLGEVWPIPPAVPTQDWWAALKVAAVAPLRWLAEPLTRYRIHGENRYSIGEQGDRWLRAVEGDNALRRWMLRTIDLDAVGVHDLLAAWTAFDGHLALLAQRRGVPVDSLLPVDALDGRRLRRRLDDAEAALAAGDVGRALRRVVAALGENPFHPAARALIAELGPVAAGAEAAGPRPAVAAARTTVATSPPGAAATTVAPAVPAGLPDLPPPEPAAKREHLLGLLRARGHDTFVESGTYLGDTTAFLRPHVDRVVSVEVEPELHAAAVARFAGDDAVDIVLGDALEVVPTVLWALDAPALVWLDGHFSGDGTGTGVFEEPAEAILDRLAERPPSPGTTIVVDDLRLFGRRAAPWPGLDGLVAAAARAFPDARIAVGLDSLVIDV